MVARALQQLDPPRDSVVMIENVGNLVCPALFDLGERAKVVIISVTEGDDKPIKYPHMFRASEVMILNKIDLLPYVHFDVDVASLSHARSIRRSTSSNSRQPAAIRWRNGTVGSGSRRSKSKSRVISSDPSGDDLPAKLLDRRCRWFNLPPTSRVPGITPACSGHQRMEFRSLGRTGLQFSWLSFGASSLGQEFRSVDFDEASARSTSPSTWA